MKSLTKVAKGIAFGDVSNISVRNILTVLSTQLYGKVTKQDIDDTDLFFDGKCPYTGEEITDDNSAMDHICPQNKESCGLNIKGNLVRTSKKVNSVKKSQDFEDFIRNDKTVIVADDKTREERIQRIKQWQKECCYDPSCIRDKIQPLLNLWYDEIRKQQEERVAIALKETGLPILKTIVTAKMPLGSKRFIPELIFSPCNEIEFKKELIRTKKAIFTLYYESGAIKSSPWNAENFDENSNLRGNIQSRPFWRDKKKDGLLKVEVSII